MLLHFCEITDMFKCDANLEEKQNALILHVQNTIYVA